MVPVYLKLDNAKRGIPSQGGGQKWPWHLTLGPKINRVPPLIMANVHMKFESDWAKTVVAIVATRFYIQYQSWPLTLWPKINRVPPLIMANVHMKCESNWAKTVVAIVSTRFYLQSAKVDLDLWPRDPKSIGFLLSSWQMCMWSVKVIGQKLWSLSCPQGFMYRLPKLTLIFDPMTQNQ